ncbi:hypothetical protein [Ruegeria sp.]|uniref:hypothetical protein n=1 Tax=Ruegeria sp. TaxID=1879320 RepID=UPI003B00D2BF
MSQTAPNSKDPRIHVDAYQLVRLGPRARALSLLPRQPARSILNGRHASRLRGRGLNFEELRGYLPGTTSGPSTGRLPPAPETPM